MDVRNKTYIYRTKNETMETIDNRESIFELEEIYKYKDLIELEIFFYFHVIQVMLQ